MYNPNNKSKPTTVAEHFFSSSNHTANDIQLIPIEENVLQKNILKKAFFVRTPLAAGSDGRKLYSQALHFLHS